MPREDYIVSAGLAVSEGTPEIGVPLAGFGGARRRTIPLDVFDRYPYATYLKPSVGVCDPIRAKAMLLRTPHANLTEARLYAGVFQANDLQNNRRGKPGQFDSQANLLLVKSARGHWLGGLVNFAIHGTALDAGNLKFSADVPGAIEKALLGF